MKALLVLVLGWALPLQALAYTISGVIPRGTTPVVIHLHKPIRPDTVQLVFYAPPKNISWRYALSFCIGQSRSPCGLPDSQVINVPEGQRRFPSFPSILLSTHVLAVRGAGSIPFSVPYSVQVTSFGRR